VAAVDVAVGVAVAAVAVAVGIAVTGIAVAVGVAVAAVGVALARFIKRCYFFHLAKNPKSQETSGFSLNGKSNTSL